MLTVGLYVCTYRRNDELRRLLDSVVRAAGAVAGRAAVGAVVVDDNADGRARAVADGQADRLPLGVHYRHVGAGNIALARNAGLAAAAELGDWVVMTDDDIVVPEDWFARLLDVQERTGADAVTGPLLLTFGPGQPAWLRRQPFDRIGLMTGQDDRPVPVGATGNSMISADWLRRHPDIRFDEDLGVIGGEDMVFYRRAVAAGLDVRYSSTVTVREIESADRATLRYQLRRALWMGNTQFVTNHRVGEASRRRLVLRGCRRMAAALARPVRRLASRRPPHLRFAMAGVAEGVGFLVGAVGVELRHR